MTTTAAAAQKSGGIGKDLIVYVCLLALAGLQFVIAYQNIDVSQMFVRSCHGILLPKFLI